MRIRHAEILEMQNGIREQLSAVLDESIDKGIVVPSPQPRSLPAHVQRVREEGVVVGTDVQDDGEDTVGVDSCSECVEGGFGGGDCDTADTLVCEGDQSQA